MESCIAPPNRRKTLVTPYRNQHVVAGKEGWAVRASGSQRATSVHRTQKAAIAAARDLARRQGTDLFIHDRNGRIRARQSYADETFPPKA